MSDTKLRDLERRWKETGTVEDEAAYLLERVRVGDLTQERLELAAYCGHEGARRAHGQPEAAAMAAGEWFDGLQAWAQLVAAAAAAVAVLRYAGNVPDEAVNRLESLASHTSITQSPVPALTADLANSESPRHKARDLARLAVRSALALCALRESPEAAATARNAFKRAISAEFWAAAAERLATVADVDQFPEAGEWEAEARKRIIGSAATALARLALREGPL